MEQYRIKNAEFVISSPDVEKCPAANFPEYAFVGRSNVGKSSLINMLTGNSGLAKTSSRPGKTQLINHFLINKSWYLADLPGFGFAKASKKMIADWHLMIKNYLLKRENLMCVLLLVDSRHDQQKVDKELMEFFAMNGIPFVIVFTKADKLSQPQLQRNIAVYKKTLLKEWENLPQMFVTSSEKNNGKEELIAFIEETNKSFHTNN
jgi:GTP-binding protein